LCQRTPRWKWEKRSGPLTIAGDANDIPHVGPTDISRSPHLAKPFFARPHPVPLPIHHPRRVSHVWCLMSGLPASDMLTLKNLTCSNVAKQLEGFRLEHFFSSVHCSVRFVCVCVCTALLSPSRMHMLLCSDILFDAHEVPHLKYAFLPLAKRKSGWEVWKMCFDKCHLCVATMKYASPPAFPPPPPPLSTRRNCNRAECKSGRAYGADELYRWLCDQCLYRVQTYTHIYANIQRKGRQGRRDLVKDVINLHRRTLAMAIWTNYKINSATYWME